MGLVADAWLARTSTVAVITHKGHSGIATIRVNHASILVPQLCHTLMLLGI